LRANGENIISEVNNRRLGASLMKLTPRQIIHAFIWVKRHLFGQYHVELISTIQRFIMPTDVCIDVGAHAGSWTLPLSKLVSEGHVYAFEAFPYYSKVLKMTIRLLRRKNITLLNNAIVDNNRSINLVWKDSKGNRLTGRTHVMGLEDKFVDSVVVEGITLDTFLGRIPTPAGKIRFIKMDIEGAELLALKGAIKLIDVHKPIFYLEIYDSYCQRYGYLAEEIFSFLGNLKYMSYLIHPENLKLISVDSSSYTGEGDVLFIPTEELSILDMN
jgi:FkbM family methyltransferase